MTRWTLSGQIADTPDMAQHIFCPSLAGLSASQADLAYVLPRLDHNHALQETSKQGDWAALLATDPLRSKAALLAQLIHRGYRGLVNWPSSILMDGALGQSMAQDLATPELEYEFLSEARGYGFDVMGFILTLEQGRAAIKAGLDRLVLHPGLLEVEDDRARALVLEALQKTIDQLRDETDGLCIFIYNSPWHEATLKLSKLDVDGVVWFEAQNGR